MFQSMRLALIILRCLGIRGSLRYVFTERILGLIARLKLQDVSNFVYPLYVSGHKHPLLCRYNSSDREVFAQVFIRRQYAGTKTTSKPCLIIDCGANVGYTTVFFLIEFSNSHVIAVEPDSHNFEVLKQNLAPFAGRTTSLQTGIWSHKTGLIVCRQVGVKREWSTKVRESKSQEMSDIMAVDIGSLLQDAEQVFDYKILKVDIEGAEEVVFSKGYQDWIGEFDLILIELHGKGSREAFFQAIGQAQYDISTSGDLTVARRLPIPKVGQTPLS